MDNSKSSPQLTGNVEKSLTLRTFRTCLLLPNHKKAIMSFQTRKGIAFQAITKKGIAFQVILFLYLKFHYLLCKGTGLVLVESWEHLSHFS